MANVIIGIHGLNNKPPKKLLEKWWKLAMIEGLRNNNYVGVLPKFELVYWADILYEKPLSISETNPENPLYFEQKYAPGSKDFKIENYNTRKRLLDYLGEQMNKIFLKKDYTLNYSFISDAIVSKFFKDLEIYYSEECTIKNKKSCGINKLIKERLIGVLKKHKTDKIMLLSHSMGSIIAFDVLSFDVENIPIDTFITMGSPLGLPVVISKIAAEHKQRMNNHNYMITPPPVLSNWYNFSDILDKVAFNYKLGDDFSKNENNVLPFDFVVVNNYQIGDKKNPHKSYGYLRTPEFAKILNEFILSEELTTSMKIKRKFSNLLNFIKEKIS